jgi:hypothetical protein
MEIFAVIGFVLAAYAVVANDSVQTLGTFITSNKKIPWGYMWIGASSVLAFTLLYSWYFYGGDISFGRLSKIPYVEPQWYHVIPPLILLLLTRIGIPVSTSFLVLSAFASAVVLEKVLIKSILGYCVAAVFAYCVWSATSFLLRKRKKDKSKKVPLRWRAFQWSSTGLLWYMWLSHDIANVAVFLPRELSLTEVLLCVGLFSFFLALMFREGGGKIQKIVQEKTSTEYVKAATLIDLCYAFVLWYFKMHNSIPMSTTWVFVGLLAGRELAIATWTNKKMGKVWPLVGKDSAKMAAGLVISVIIAFSIQEFS